MKLSKQKMFIARPQGLRYKTFDDKKKKKNFAGGGPEQNDFIMKQELASFVLVTKSPSNVL